MEKLFKIKKNLPYEYENFRSGVDGDTVQRIQFDLTQEITLEIAQSLEKFFDDYFQSFNMNMDFNRNNITIQRK